GRRYVTGGIRWLIHWLIIAQRRPTVVIPDVLLAQVVWGSRDHWPRNWRKRVERLLSRKDKPSNRAKDCPTACPLRHSHQLHRQLSYSVRTLHNSTPDKTFLGVLELFGFKDSTRAWVYDWSKLRQPTDERTPATQAELQSHRKAGRLVAVY